jgi:hypothetical protein
MAGLLVQEATDEQILRLAEEWVELLGKDQYEDAFDLIPASAPWTPALLKATIERRGSAGPADAAGGLRGTSPLTVLRAAYARRVRRWGDPSVMKSLGHVEYDLPLAGQWPEKQAAGSSNLRLTALFDLKLLGKEIATEFFDLQLCSVRPDRSATDCRFRLMRFRNLQTYGPIAPTMQRASLVENRVPVPDQDMLKPLIAEQFERPKPRWLPRLTNYDPTVCAVRPVDDQGFFQKHALLEVEVEGSFLEWHPLPSATSGGLFAWDGKDLLYLNRGHQQNFEFVLRSEARPLHQADPYALAAVLAEALLRVGNDDHVVLRTPDDMETALWVSYELDEAEFSRVSKLIRPPVITGDSGAGWLLRFWTLHGWMHEKRTVSWHECAFSPSFSITHRQHVVSRSIFSTILGVVY